MVRSMLEKGKGGGDTQYTRKFAGGTHGAPRLPRPRLTPPRLPSSFPQGPRMTGAVGKEEWGPFTVGLYKGSFSPPSSNPASPPPPRRVPRLPLNSSEKMPIGPTVTSTPDAGDVALGKTQQSSRPAPVLLSYITTVSYTTSAPFPQFQNGGE